MSYLVIARKWRPMIFEDVIGQEHVSTTLQNAIISERLAHAYIFAGPRGTGKTTTARLLAKAINCENGPSVNPCGKCANCQEITSGKSLDVYEIDGASNRGIDEVRNLRENVRFTPTRGKYKVYIIDEVHMLTTPAFNALLKTLEEPPSHVVFIFATTEPHNVPATILSRCQRFDFRRLTIQQIVSRLDFICKSENIFADEEALILIAKKADGGMRDAQSILDQILSFSGNKISKEDIIKTLGLVEQELFFDFTDLILDKDTKGGLNLVQKITERGYDYQEFLIGLSEHFRNLLVAKSVGSTDLIEASDHYKQMYKEKSEKFNENDLLRLIKISTDAEFLIKKSSYPRLKLEMALLQMIKIDNTILVDDLIKKIEELKKEPEVTTSRDVQLNAPTKPEVKPESYINKTSLRLQTVKDTEDVFNKKIALPAGIADMINSGIATENRDNKSDIVHTVTLEQVKTKWSEVIDEVKKRNKIALANFLLSYIPVKVDGKVLNIAFSGNVGSNNFYTNAIMRDRQFIEEVIMNKLNADLRVKCIDDYSTNSVKKIEFQEVKVKSDGSKKEINDPIIKKIIEVFDGEIVN